MRLYHFSYLTILLLIAFATGCQIETSTETSETTFASYAPDPDFNEYWYSGKAEITSYKLNQARYGEIHPGHAVLIFVTEPFSKSKQVKLDYPDRAGDDEVTVMKLNMTKKFNTGIYPYSMMQSTFTPVQIDQFPHTYKVTTSSQEWCGHTFLQLNSEKNKYRVRGLSYFESEGDTDFTLRKTWLEDELWTRIRLEPQSLPTGTIDIIPGTFFSRLKHIQLDVVQAEATLKDTESGDLMAYSLEYPGYNRSLTIRFNQAFPHEIESWEEVYGSRGQGLKTTASRMERIKTAYWTQNSLKDTVLRKQLRLDI